jgi:hypothetical protein
MRLRRIADLAFCSGTIQRVNANISQSFGWGRSVLLGCLATAALMLCSPVWMLAQLGSPVPFYFLWGLIVGPLLLLALLLVKARSVTEAVRCGLMFSTPLLAVPCILPALDPNVRQFFRTELWCDGAASIVVSVGSMALVAFLRQHGNTNGGNQLHSGEPNPAPNGGPETTPGKSRIESD